jgi:DNA-binding transcriptional LysR family regulator
MNIDLARTFLEVVSAGSFAKAAMRLHITNSAVTMRIKALEDILRRRVLVRNKTGVSMTAEGVRFHRFAETMVRAWQMSRREMSIASGFKGRLSIGAETGLWPDLMHDWAYHTRVGRPNLAIRCEDGSAQTLLPRLFQGLLDICLVHTAQSRSGFVIDELFEDPLMLVSTEDRDLLPQADSSYIEVDWDDTYQIQIERLWGYSDDTPHISTNSEFLGLQLIDDFGGTIYLPKRIFETRAFKRKLYPVRDAPLLSRSVFMIYSPESLEERLPNTSIEQLRLSILRQFSGNHPIWDEI